MNLCIIAALNTAFLFFQFIHTAQPPTHVPLSPGPALRAAAATLGAPNNIEDSPHLMKYLKEFLPVPTDDTDIDDDDNAPLFPAQPLASGCNHKYVYTWVDKAAQLARASNCKKCGEKHPSKGEPQKKGTLTSQTSRQKGTKLVACPDCGSIQRKDNFKRHKVGGAACRRQSANLFNQQQS